MIIHIVSCQSVSLHKPLQVLGGGTCQLRLRLQLFYICNDNNNDLLRLFYFCNNNNNDFIQLLRPILRLFYIPVLSNNNDDDSNGFNNNDFIDDDSNGFNNNDFINRLFCSINNNDFIDCLFGLIVFFRLLLSEI